MEFKEELVAARKRIGVSRYKMAKAYGIPQTTMMQWENGDRTPPKYVQRLLLADIERRSGKAE